MIETSQNDRFLLRITLIRQDLLALHTHKLYKHGMANSLFISCELQRPEKNYDRIVAAIQSVGEPWTQWQFTLWYLKTDSRRDKSATGSRRWTGTISWLS
jgi:hypothetical protein